MKWIFDKTRREFMVAGTLGTLGTVAAFRDLSAVLADSTDLSGLSLESADLTAIVSKQGNSLRFDSSSTRRVVELGAKIEGYSPVGDSIVRRLPNGALEMKSTVADLARGQGCVLIERFSSGNRGIHWELDIHPDGAPRTAPIHMIARYPATQNTRFWTAWSDPGQGNAPMADQPVRDWEDPLILAPLAKRRLFYGAPYFTLDDPDLQFFSVYRDILAIPLVSFLEPESDIGFSMALSPEAGDGMLDLTLDTDEKGIADFAFHYYRLDSNHTLRFAADLTLHEADWRGGLRWMTETYPRYFNPVLPLAEKLDGTAAYSTDNNTDFDPEKLRDMAFRVNWKASFDFPYMGMFLPPIDKGSWTRFSGDSYGHRVPNLKGGEMSVREMAEYSEKMRALGFYVLNYFNVAEFGADIVYPAPPRVTKLDSDLWMNANDFLYGRIPKAIIHIPAGIPQGKLDPRDKTGGPYYTWGNGIILDCGEQEYGRFLLQQAQAHIEKLPASSGICIDRMDWLRLYNDRGDDGISWICDKPVRSLYVSWRTLMTKLLPLMHEAGKVVFVNNLLKRFDLLFDIDGVFDEFAVNGRALNLTALLAVKRPALGWTNDEEAIRSDPDGFFQRFLYMGVFPMAPFPGNDHSILPSAWADREYLNYGPLLNAMHGRKWVLEPHAVEVLGGVALANIFSLTDGYVIPVMFGGNRTSAKVSVCNFASLNRFRANVLHPGTADSVPVSWSDAGTRIVFEVPLVRGCALLRLQKVIE